MKAAVLLVLPFLAVAAPAYADAIEDKAATCAACHGDNGVPKKPKFPIIWGQHAGYLYIELKDMQSGARKNDVMAPIVKDLTKDEMLALAEYFEAKPWPSTGYAASTTDDAKGQQVAVAGQCSGCHLNGFLGSSVVPRLAGQNVEYLTKTTHDFKTRDRANNSAMNDLMATYADDDIAAMSRYLAGLSP